MAGRSEGRPSSSLEWLPEQARSATANKSEMFMVAYHRTVEQIDGIRPAQCRKERAVEVLMLKRKCRAETKKISEQGKIWTDICVLMLSPKAL